MPRRARKQSESGIYHVMLRGINKQQIFEETDDFEKFVEVLKYYKAISGYKIFAYCLMSNHVHILIKIESESLEQVIKRIAGKYVYWYNIKYQRIGHLFQDRFKSEPVENDSYFLTVIRYIHQNPIKAGICTSICDYKYSSYQEYIEKTDVVDHEFVYEVLEKDEFLKFNNEVSFDTCLEINEKRLYRVTVEQAQSLIEKYSKCKSISQFQALDIKSRDKYLRIFKEKNLSIRQISRLTGVSYYIVQKA